MTVLNATAAAQRDLAYHLHPSTNLRLVLREGPLVITRGEGVHVFDDQGNRYTTRRTETAREGTLSGTIGAMDFADDADDQAYGYFGTFKTASTSVNP